MTLAEAPDMPVLHGHAQEADTPSCAPPAPLQPRGVAQYKLRPCPECRQQFRPKAWNQMFCSTDHKDAFHNRQTVRGRQLVPAVMAARQTRDGTQGDRETGGKAGVEARRLMRLYRDEDRAKNRMSMVEYWRLRNQLGL
jgi:hypothetical protein